MEGTEGEESADEYLQQLVGADYASLKSVSVPVGYSGYLDLCDALHLKFARAVKGVDAHHRPFVVFYLELVEDGAIADCGIFTVFRRYSAHNSMYVVCRSHSLPRNYGIEAVLGDVRIDEDERVRLNALFRSGEYSEETRTLRLKSPPLHLVLAAGVYRGCPLFARLGKYFQRGLNAFWSVVPRLMVDADAHEHVE